MTKWPPALQKTFKKDRSEGRAGELTKGGSEGNTLSMTPLFSHSEGRSAKWKGGEEGKKMGAETKRRGEQEVGGRIEEVIEKDNTSCLIR